ncbi:hypothetical protein GCM10009411_22050 [Shewanella litoralis]|uniref:Uncharacterized protein n=1 Tax=Shewanella litoralis TaxID=2282700 RepID=A0ABQ2RDQ3_9GAMM|nr:hypothetical protein GCM10009411_22050 [Shewanella litoralis]
MLKSGLGNNALDAVFRVSGAHYRELNLLRKGFYKIYLILMPNCAVFRLNDMFLAVYADIMYK